MEETESSLSILTTASLEGIEPVAEVAKTWDDVILLIEPFVHKRGYNSYARKPLCKLCSAFWRCYHIGEEDVLFWNALGEEDINGHES